MSFVEWLDRRTSADAVRSSHLLCATVSGLEVETRLRCFDDNHPAGVFNPALGGTFCHCGRVCYEGLVETVVWPDRQARLIEHVAAAARESDNA